MDGKTKVLRDAADLLREFDTLAIDVDCKAVLDFAELEVEEFANKFGVGEAAMEATRLDGRVVDVWDGNV